MPMGLSAQAVIAHVLNCTTWLQFTTPCARLVGYCGLHYSQTANVLKQVNDVDLTRTTMSVQSKGPCHKALQTALSDP